MKNILIRIIQFYQKYISPQTPPSCRYHPTCSTYALEAVEKHGALKGSVMGTARVLRCNPFVEGGVDEVPDHFTIFRNPANLNDQYIPAFLMPVNKEAQAQTNELLKKHKDQLQIADQLPASMEVLQKIADVKELTTEEIKKEFSKEELVFLKDIRIFPDLASDEYQYFTLPQTEKNRPYLTEVENFDPDVELGADYPLVVLEKTGIWYTNMSHLAQTFLIARGVTPADIETKSYHLWLVLEALEHVGAEEK